jgi:hypothetical protein
MRESLREQVLEAARAQSSVLGIASAFVWVHWHGNVPSPAHGTNLLATNLLSLVGRYLPADGKRVKLGIGFDFDVEFVDPVFDRITIDRTVDHGGVLFTTAYSDWLQPLTRDGLANRIREKSAKNRAGMSEVAEHWLVLYGAFGPLSSYVEPSADTLGSRYESAFDRTYLTFLAEKRLWLLHTTRSTLGA